MLFGIDWGRLVSLSFWLDTTPGDLSKRFEIIFLVILAVCYGVWAISKALQKQFLAKGDDLDQKFWGSFGALFFSLAVSFSFIFFFRYEAIPYLGGRYWMLIWFFCGAIGLGKLLYRYYFKIPALRQQRRESQEKKKYM